MPTLLSGLAHPSISDLPTLRALTLPSDLPTSGRSLLRSILCGALRPSFRLIVLRRRTGLKPEVHFRLWRRVHRRRSFPAMSVTLSAGSARDSPGRYNTLQLEM